jgi:glycosyltransferase involved in cell wall biosynthesis
MTASANVSTILATFNPELLQLDLAVQSILAQRFAGELDLVIVDDSVDDRLDGYLATLASDRVRLVRGPRKGLGAAKSVGYLAAKFDLIAHMDSDDVSHPLRFAHQISAIRSGIDVCGTNTSYFGDRRGGQTFVESDRAIKFSLAFGTFVSHPSVMVNRARLGDDGLYKELDVCEDYEIWSRLALKGFVFQNLQRRLLKYRVHAGQATVTRQARIEEVSSGIRLDYVRSADFSEDFRRYFESHRMAFWPSLPAGAVDQYWRICRAEARRSGVSPHDLLRVFYAVLGRSSSLSASMLARTALLPRARRLGLDAELQLRSKASILSKLSRR